MAGRGLLGQVAEGLAGGSLNPVGGAWLKDPLPLRKEKASSDFIRGGSPLSGLFSAQGVGREKAGTKRPGQKRSAKKHAGGFFTLPDGETIENSSKDNKQGHEKTDTKAAKE